MGGIGNSDVAMEADDTDGVSLAAQLVHGMALPVQETDEAVVVQYERGQLTACAASVANKVLIAQG